MVALRIDLDAVSGIDRLCIPAFGAARAIFDTRCKYPLAHGATGNNVYYVQPVLGHLSVHFPGVAGLAPTALPPAMGRSAMGYFPPSDWCETHHDWDTTATNQHAVHPSVYHYLEYWLEAVSKIRGFGVFAAALPPQTHQLTIFGMTMSIKHRLSYLIATLLDD